MNDRNVERIENECREYKKTDKELKDAYLTGERPLFRGKKLHIEQTIFNDGESPLKESRDIVLENSSFQWKYPLWYSKI